MKNIVRSFANQIDGAILENNAKSNLFSLLVKLIKTSEKNVNLVELRKTFRETKVNYVSDLNSDYSIFGDIIYINESILEKSDIERNYILNRALARLLILKNHGDQTLMSIAMEEALADLANNYAVLNNSLTRGQVESENRLNRDFVEMLLSLSSNKSGVITEYFFGSRRIFLGKLRATLAKNNLGLSSYNNLTNLVHNEKVVDSGDFDYIFSQTNFNQLLDMCYKEDFLDLMSSFTYNNIFLQKYIINQYLQNNRSLEKFEMFTLNIPSKNKLNITDDSDLLEEYLKNRPEDFYRLRPYINEENLSNHIKDVLDKLDQEFNAIITNIDNGLVVSGISKYTYCYNPNANIIDRRIFLEQLVLSNGITNGFLLNELLEILKNVDIRKIKSDADKEYIYNLIVEGTKQFLDNSYLNNNKPYDAYTSKVLESAKHLLSKYSVKNPITIPVAYHEADFVTNFLNSYDNQRRNEFKYLILKFHRSGFLKNPNTFVLPELMEIVNDKNIVVYKKYFEGILNSQLQNNGKKYTR
jgi:hypothetical protein